MSALRIADPNNTWFDVSVFVCVCLDLQAGVKKTYYLTSNSNRAYMRDRVYDIL